MNISCAPGGIVDAKQPKQGMGDIVAAGFTSMLLDMREEIPSREYVNMIKSHRLMTVVAYTSCGKTALEDWVTQIRLAAESGCKYLVIQMLDMKEQRDLLTLAEVASQEQMTLLFINQYKNSNGHLIRGIGSDAQKVALWLDELNLAAKKRLGIDREIFGFCMDTAVCNICAQSMYEFATVLGTRIKAVLLRECDGYRDVSMLPFTCAERGKTRIDWLGMVRGLRQIDFDGELILDIKDTAMAFSPLLRPNLIGLAKEIAEYFRWQIQMEQMLKKFPSIVLFGAGNMCRNYMKCYGQSYPPQFTCDNNSTLWGTDFCGLEVKSPECLKELSKETVILICNVYYREIKKQLEDMGISNPIFFFNDEYMPSFFTNTGNR